MPSQWTEAQIQAITTLDRDVCVAAGAGSGKTGVLTERFVRIVSAAVDGSLPEHQRAGVDQILVFTFTEKATREMKARIVARLTELGLEEQRRQIETAYLSTMHGFCSRLLKENPFEAGIDPEFEVLDETQARRMLRRACDAAIERAFSEADDEIIDLVIAMQDERIFGIPSSDTLGPLAESVERVMGRLRETGLRRQDVEALLAAGRDRVAAWSVAPIEALVAPILANVAAAADALRPLRAAAAGALELSRREVVRLADGLTRVPLGSADIDLAGFLANLRELFKACGKKVRTISKADSDVAAELGRIHSQLEQAKDLFEMDVDREKRARDLSHAFWRLMAEAWRHYEDAKSAAGALDQTDLQAEAVHLLETCEPVRRRYRRRFRHILVDEFQDTNPIQLRLIRLLHENRTADEPRSCLFVVGDEQQSIYGFRGTDARIFQTAVREFQEESDRAFVAMVHNHRSRAEVVAFVNHVFGRIGHAAGIPFRALEPAGDYEPSNEPCVEILVAPRTPRDHYPAMEAEALAEHIRRMVEGRTASITDRRSPRFGEPVRYGDCALLFRSLTSVAAYEDAFAAAGVPFFVVGGGRGYYARREVRDILNALAVLDTPADDLALAATLRSPMVGVSMDTLAKLHEIGSRDDRPRGPLYLSLRPYVREARVDDPDGERIRHFVELMDSLREQADTLTVGAILERIMEGTRYDARVLVRRDGRRRLANVRKLLWMAHAAPDRRVSEFVRSLREIEKLAEREGDAPTEEEAADVVRFLTVHKAKGLEFPVVYVVDLSRSLRHRSEGLFECDPTARAIACRLGSYKSAAYRAIVQSREERDLHEAHRVLYVAMTRARERLVLSGAADKRRQGASWADAVFGHLGIVDVPREPRQIDLAHGLRVRVAPLQVEGSA